MSPPAPVKGSSSAEVKIAPPPAKLEEKPKDPPKVDSTDPANDPKELVYKGTLGVQAGTNGYNDSYLFPGAFGKFGDHINTHLDVGLMHDVTGGKFRLRLGGQLNGDFIRGDHSTSGASTNLISIGPRVEADWRRGFNFGDWAIFSRVGLDLGLGYFWGTTPAETISLHSQSAFGMRFGVDANVVNVNIRQVEMGLDFLFSTQVGDGSKFNSAYNFVGAGLTFRPAVTRKPLPVEVEVQKPVCGSTKALLERLRSEINGKDGQPGLQAQVKEYEAKVAEKRELLKTRPIDPLDDNGVLTVLRDQRASEYSQKDLVGLDPKKDADKIKEIKAKAAVKAEADFPDVETFWNPSPRQINEKDLVIPDPLPEDCTKLDEMFTTASKAKDDLAARLEQLKKVNDAPFPPRIREIVSKVVDTVRPNLKNIHFENNRPSAVEITHLKKQLAAATNGGKVDWDDKKLQATMKGIFGASYVPAVVQTIKDTATALNGDLVKEVKNLEVQGHTSKAGGDGVNVPLSDRRANMIMEMLIAEGVDRSRMSAKGYGYSRPVTPEEGLKAGSAEAGQAAADNRRIELSVPESEITRIESMGGAVPLITPKKKPPSDGDKKPAEKKDETKPPAKKDPLDFGKPKKP